MRLEPLTTWASVASLLVATLMTAAVLSTAAAKDDLLDEKFRALGVSHEIAALLLLTQEISQYNLPRSEQQWLSRYGLLMGALAARPSDATTRADLREDLIQGGIQLKETFELVRASLAGTGDPLEQERRSLALSHIQSQLSDMNDVSLKWYTQASEERERNADLIRYGAMTASVILFLVVLGMVAIIRLRVLRPLLQVRQAAARIEAGCLDAPISIAGNDEIGDVAHGIDEMRNSIVAQHDRLQSINQELSEEVVRRTEAERALQSMNLVLETRVLQRTEELVNQAAELERKNIELQRFAYVASHDLKTPLRSIHGFIELLQSRLGASLDEQSRDWIGRVFRSTERLQTLIDDLLAYSRLDNRELEMMRVNLHAVVEEVTDMLSRDIADAGATLRVEGALPVVKGDRLALLQMLLNLVANSIKYRGKEAPRIVISSQLRDGDHMITVEDNGLGIPEQQREAVFEPFRRLHSQYSIPGSGVGLSICKRVVERHGGKIWVESGEAAGSRFCFTLKKGELS